MVTVLPVIFRLQHIAAVNVAYPILYTYGCYVYGYSYHTCMVQNTHVMAQNSYMCMCTAIILKPFTWTDHS